MRSLGITLILVGILGVAWVLLPIAVLCVRYGRPVNVQMDSITSLLLSFAGAAPPMIGVDIGASYVGICALCAGIACNYWSKP